MASETKLLYDEYAAITQRHKALYGEETVVLMEVGSFLEWYNCDRGLGADVPRICGLLGVQATRKNKSIAQVSRSNPAFSGVPRVAMAKYVQMLVDAGFSVVLVMQVTPPPNPRREVTEVVSAATCAASSALAGAAIAGDADGSAGRPLMAVHVEASSGGSTARPREWLVAGWAVVDLETGRTSAGECASEPGDLLRPLDAVRRAVAAARPSETVLCRSGPVTVEEVCAHVGLPARSVRDRPGAATPAQQNATLSRAFPKTGFLTPAEFVDLERSPQALAAFVAAIRFAVEHNAAVVERIQRPEIWGRPQAEGTGEGPEALELDAGPDTMRQLDVVASEGASADAPSLARLLNRCRTPPGRRAFLQRILAPLTDVEAIERRLDDVDRASSADGPRLRACLDGVGDLERAFRRGVCLRRATALDLAALVAALHACAAALRVADEPPSPPGAEDEQLRSAAEDADAVRRAVLSRVDVDALLSATSAAEREPRSFFVRGVHRTVDEMQDELDRARAVFHAAAAALNAAIGADHVKVESGDASEGWHLSVTPRRWAASVASGAAARAIVEPWFRGSDAEIAPGGSRRLVHPALGPAASERVSKAAAALSAELGARLGDLLDELAEAHADAVWRVVRQVERVDVAACCARNAAEMRLVRPTLVARGPSSHSFFRAAALRHPIIESLLVDRQEAFVPNDVSLGCDGVGGVLLYGVNAVGKSSTMKAVGLAVVMAQAGMPVAADRLELAPFRGLYTRIGLHDDLARGHSTFVVEMLELRAILSRAGPWSLVIGDELCAGTEAPSAVSIVGAGVVQLAERGAPFVLATHLHELVRLPQVLARPEVKAMHLDVQHDDKTGRLVLRRKLAPGPGRQTYGLEVCRSLDMDPEFMSKAEAIRDALLAVKDDERFSTKPSRYNAAVIVDLCRVCGAKAEETHHIVPQAEADPSVKHRKHNLAPLCESCHREVHSGRLNILGYRTTSEGTVLEVARSTTNPSV